MKILLCALLLRVGLGEERSILDSATVLTPTNNWTWGQSALIDRNFKSNQNLWQGDNTGVREF